MSVPHALYMLDEPYWSSVAFCLHELIMGKEGSSLVDSDHAYAFHECSVMHLDSDFCGIGQYGLYTLIV